jgi:ABC-type sugar transport system permease subunit
VKKKITIETRKKIHGLAFAAPWIIGLLAFWVYPVVMSFAMSLNKITPMASGYIWEFNGFGNYNQLLVVESAFLDQLLPFMAKTIIITPIIVLFAVIVALLLNQKFYGRGFFRAIYFLPVLFTTGGVIIALMTNNGTGVGTGSTETTTNMTAGGGTATVSFLTNPALVAFVKANVPPLMATALEDILNSFILILWYAGIQITLLIAGCQSIPGTIYEAASIDGANGWETLWKITLPGIFPFILISLIYTLVDQCTVQDNPLFLLIDAAINTNATYQGMGYASTIGWIFQIMIMALIGLIFFLFRRVNKPAAR